MPHLRAKGMDPPAGPGRQRPHRSMGNQGRRNVHQRKTCNCSLVQKLWVCPTSRPRSARQRSRPGWQLMAEQKSYTSDNVVIPEDVLHQARSRKAERGAERVSFSLDESSLDFDFSEFSVEVEEFRPPVPDVDLTEPEPHSHRMSDMNREEVKARLEASEARVASALDGMRADMSTIKNDVLTAIANVRTDHAKDQVVATRWAVGLIFAILLGAVSTVATVIVRTSAKSTPTQQAPLIIQVPSYAPAGNAAEIAPAERGAPSSKK